MPLSPSLTLAQLGDLINAPIPPLPEPPALQRFLLEQPAIPAAALVVLAILLFLGLRNAGKPKQALIGTAAALLTAAIVFATGTLIDTRRERLIVAQDELIRAVAEADMPTLESLLSSDARIRAVSLPTLGGGLERPGILNAVERTTGGNYPVTDYGTIERQGVIDGPNTARTQVYLKVESTLGSLWTWFRITWRLDDNDAWHAVEIEPLYMSGGVLPYRDGL